MSKRLLLAAVILGAATLPALAADDPVAARVNGTEIHRSDVLREMEMQGIQPQQAVVQKVYPEILDRVIALKLASAQGYAEKLQNEPEVKEKMKDAEKVIVAETYVHRTVMPRITDAKIKAMYDKIVADYKPQEEVRARHILVKTEDEANDIIKQLKDGADFAKLASEKSTDTGSAKQGGDLGYFQHDTMVKAFADAAFAMKPGEVSDKPVKTEYGYHIIKVEDRHMSSAPPLADLKGRIVAQLGQKETDELLKSLEAKAHVEKFNLDGSPMSAADAAK